MSRILFIAIVVAAVSLGLARSSGAQVVADSVADWNAARSNGLGIIGADDTPEQGHLDKAGSGKWFYREINTTTFQQTDLVWDEGMDVYDRINNGSFDIPILGSDWTHPGSGNVATNRLWNTSLPAGTQLRVQGTANVTGGAQSNGVAVFIVLNNGVATPNFQGIATPGSPASWDFTVTLPDNGAAGNFLNFAVGNNGSEGFDTTAFSTSISIVPEPVGAGLLGIAGLALLPRRRRDRRAA